MKRTWLNSGILILATAFLLSCGSNEAEEAEKRTEITQIIDGMSTKDVLNQLYIFSEGDTEALARILLCTPSSIDRIRKGETTATPEYSINCFNAYTPVCKLSDNSKRIKEVLPLSFYRRWRF